MTQAKPHPTAAQAEPDEVEIPRIHAPFGLVDRAYRSKETICHRFAVRPHDPMRYEDMRGLVAAWINNAAERFPAAFGACVFDVWLAQQCEQGVFRNRMNLVLAAAKDGRLPGFELQALLKAAPNYVDSLLGCNHIALGAFPELRVAAGTVLHSWATSVDFVERCSEKFRALHNLAADTNDPYRQMIADADEPARFAWNLRA